MTPHDAGALFGFLLLICIILAIVAGICHFAFSFPIIFCILIVFILLC